MINNTDIDEEFRRSLARKIGEFKAREDEVKQNLLFVTESWNYILGDKDTVYLPANMYLEAPSASISTLDYYQQMALMNRSEIQALQLSHINSTVSNHVTASIGVASLVPKQTETTEKIKLAADNALYRAKDQGRNSIVEAAMSETSL